MKSNNEEISSKKFVLALISIILFVGLFVIGLVMKLKIDNYSVKNEKCKKEKVICKKKVKELEKKIKHIEKENLTLKQKLQLAKKVYNSKLLTNKDKIISWILKNHIKAYKKLCNTVIDYLSKNSKYPLVMLALVSVESSFDFQVISSKGAYGGTQVKCSDWKDKLKKEKIIDSCRDLFDPITSLKAGEWILEYYINKCGSLDKGLRGYLSGKCDYKYDKYNNDIYKRIAELYLISIN